MLENTKGTGDKDSPEYKDKIVRIVDSTSDSVFKWIQENLAIKCDSMSCKYHKKEQCWPNHNKCDTLRDHLKWFLTDEKNLNLVLFTWWRLQEFCETYQDLINREYEVYNTGRSFKAKEFLLSWQPHIFKLMNDKWCRLRAKG